MMPQSREGEGPQRRRKGLASASSGCREKKLSWRNPEMGGGGDLPDGGLRAILASTNFVRERGKDEKIPPEPKQVERSGGSLD